MDVHHIASSQKNAGRIDAFLREAGKVDVCCACATGDGDHGAVGAGLQTASACNGLGQGKRNIVERQQPGLAHFAVDIGAAMAVGMHSHSHLRLADDARKGTRDDGARLLFSETGNLDIANIRKLNHSLGTDVVAARLCHGIDRQVDFGVFPNDDMEQIARANGIGTWRAKKMPYPRRFIGL